MILMTFGFCLVFEQVEERSLWLEDAEDGKYNQGASAGRVP